MSRITDLRRALAAAVEPLLKEGEAVSVAPAPSEFERGLARHGFTVTVTVGPSGSESVAERLDELLSGVVVEALEAAEPRPKVTKHSGYQSLPGGADGARLLGASFTAQVIN